MIIILSSNTFIYVTRKLRRRAPCRGPLWGPQGALLLNTLQGPSGAVPSGCLCNRPIGVPQPPYRAYTTDRRKAPHGPIL